MGLLIFYALIAIGFSFLCSILEAVLLSVTPSYVAHLLKSNPNVGNKLEKYKSDVDIPLSGILTLNTIAHTVGAILVGVQAGSLFGSTGFNLFGLEIHFETIVAILMTLGILILSEIIPKTIGANYWKFLTPFAVRAISMIIFILYPLVWVSKLITSKLKNDKDQSVLSRADFAAIASIGQESGVLGREESEIITNLLNFEKRKVRDIMTPRSVAFFIQENKTLNDFISNPEATTYSRVPVFGRDKDHIEGMVLKDDIFSTYLKEDGKNKAIKEIMRPINFVSDQMPLHDYFNKLTDDRQHMSVVMDEYGNIVGLITMEDVFETLLGKEIIDESDKVTDLQALAKQRVNKGFNKN